ncbi:hypothetical protein AC578_5262 [Pseudocercospora eumusae]|uniref:Mid2 domain-containing protein n=1 Tax=Pseudocercospora eumusae TaxID=321146 RepID=A0A139GZH8_9PEZI|nr:hypothetical protein AC578_5262 [Pseudocercospora eumusae]
MAAVSTSMADTTLYIPSGITIWTVSLPSGSTVAEISTDATVSNSFGLWIPGTITTSTTLDIQSLVSELAGSSSDADNVYELKAGYLLEDSTTAFDISNEVTLPPGGTILIPYLASIPTELSVADYIAALATALGEVTTTSTSTSTTSATSSTSTHSALRASSRTIATLPTQTGSAEAKFQEQSKGLATGAKAGIAVGVIVGVLALSVAAFLLWRRRRKISLKSHSATPGLAESELQTEGKPEVELSQTRIRQI